MQKGKEHEKERAFTLNSYASFLAGSKKVKEAENALQEALRIEPKYNDAAADLAFALRATSPRDALSRIPPPPAPGGAKNATLPFSPGPV